MALRTAVCRVVTSFRGASLRAWSKIPATQILRPQPPIRALPYTTQATQQLLTAVDAELKLERKSLDKLPSVPGFETSITGATATLTRTHGGNTVKVEMDANHSMEVTPESSMDSEGEDEEDDIEPMFVPVFTVTVTKPTGDCVQCECSFEEYGPYLERGGSWESMKIDSVSVIPAGTKDLPSVFSADTRNLSDALYEQLVAYLSEHGINEHFADDALEFYKTFEHTCYCNSFLEELKQFLSKQ